MKPVAVAAYQRLMRATFGYWALRLIVFALISLLASGSTSKEAAKGHLIHGLVMTMMLILSGPRRSFGHQWIKLTVMFLVVEFTSQALGLGPRLFSSFARSHWPINRNDMQSVETGMVAGGLAGDSNRKPNHWCRHYQCTPSHHSPMVSSSSSSSCF